MKTTKLFVLAAVLVLFAIGGCVESDAAQDADSNGSASDAEAVDNNTETSEPAETASSSSEDSENDSVPADINYDNYDAGIPDGFPDVIPVYDIANSTVMGGMEQDAGRTMMYSLVLGSNDEISDISETIINSLENIDLNIADESSALLIGYMGDWDYTITVNNGEADGFVAVITYSIVEKE